MSIPLTKFTTYQLREKAQQKGLYIYMRGKDRPALLKMLQKVESGYIYTLNNLTVVELKKLAARLDLTHTSNIKKKDLIEEISETNKWIMWSQNKFGDDIRNPGRYKNKKIDPDDFINDYEQRFKNPKSIKDFKWIASKLDCRKYGIESGDECGKRVKKIFRTVYSMYIEDQIMFFIVKKKPRKWRNEFLAHFYMDYSVLRKQLDYKELLYNRNE